jgi:acetoacetate decarboxylase
LRHLTRKAARLVGVLDRRIVGRRYFPRLSAGLHDRPAVDELVQCVSDQLQITNIWIGGGPLSFPEAYGEELEVLGPLKVGRGYRFSFSYSVTDIEVLADLTARNSDKQVDALQSNQLSLISSCLAAESDSHIRIRKC